MKKTTKIFAFIVTIITMFMAMTIVSSASYYEYESNNDYASANTLGVNNSIVGNLSNMYDADFYKIVAPSNGKLTIRINHEYVSNGAWTVVLYKYENGQYNNLGATQVNSYGNETVSVPTIGAKANGVYYIKVSTGTSNVEGYEYTLTAGFVSTNYYEKELNDDYATATAISVNNQYGGVMHRMYDTDYYKIVAPSKGKLTIQINHAYNSNGSWSVVLYKYSNGQYSSLTSAHVNAYNSEATILTSVGTVTNGVYYVKVSTGSSEAVGVEYKIKARFGYDINNDGVVNSKDTGLYKIGGVWRYVKSGEPSNSFTGLCKRGNYWYYVNKGIVDFDYTGLAKRSDKWYYVEDGKVDFSYTGLCKYGKKWYYVEDGRVDFTFTGLCKYNKKWYYVEDGIVDKTYMGLCKRNGTWYYVNKGVVDFSYTGFCKRNGKWYYVDDGRVNFKYTGYVKYNGKTYKVVKGVKV